MVLSDTKYKTMLLVTGTIFLDTVTKYNSITWSGTKNDTMLWGQLPFVTLSFGYGTKYYNILTRHRYNNIAVTTANVYTSAKCNTVEHKYICGTKCNNND